MNRRVLHRTPGLAAALALALTAGGCSDDKLYDPESMAEFSTLTVSYGDPGPSFSPCDDRLPVVDGVAADDEWASAKPLMVHLTGANGSGGDDVFAEVRAVWTNEGKFLGGEDRIYFMIRFEDDDDNQRADQLVYGTDVEIRYEEGVAKLAGAASPRPVYNEEGRNCDPVILDPQSWTRINREGREDQVLIAMAEFGESNGTDLIAANQRLLSVVGAEVTDGASIPGARDLDVWIWRATRTNYHPVPQFAAWGDYRPGTAVFQNGEIDAPDAIFEKFAFHAGFFEDLYVDLSGSLTRDPGTRPFVKNFTGRDPVPDKITQLETRARGGDDGNEGFGGGAEDPTVINGSLPKDRVLWWPTAKNFNVCDTVATSRVGVQKVAWSQGLVDDEVDKINGWALQTPTGSARDVRGAGLFSEITDKGFTTRTVEFMRPLDTGHSDDLLIEPGVKRYRIVIGIFDDSGRRASGSTEILLEFEPVKPAVNLPRKRC